MSPGSAFSRPRDLRPWLVALALGVAACASTPRPRVLDRALAVSESPAAKEAKQLAPQAFARAEGLRARAEAAHEAGDAAGAQILAEHAEVAYQRAFVEARLVRAEERLRRAVSAEGKLREGVVALDAQQARLQAEVEGLELRAKVIRDAVPLQPSAPSSPEREAARLEAARALGLDARLLCTAARLLQGSSAPSEAATAAFKAVEALDAALAGKPAAAPIDAAIAARSGCLALLTAIRRTAPAGATSQPSPDALLEELSRTGTLAPARDDRGVAVALRALFAGDGKLRAEARETLATLGRVAKAHAGHPVLVVVHESSPSPTRDRERAERVAAALREAGAAVVEVALAGATRPLVPRGRDGAAARNDRIEVVFVTPGS